MRRHVAPSSESLGALAASSCREPRSLKGSSPAAATNRQLCLRPRILTRIQDRQPQHSGKPPRISRVRTLHRRNPPRISSSSSLHPGFRQRISRRLPSFSQFLTRIARNLWRSSPVAWLHPGNSRRNPLMRSGSVVSLTRIDEVLTRVVAVSRRFFRVSRQNPRVLRRNRRCGMRVGRARRRGRAPRTPPRDRERQPKQRAYLIR